MGFLNRWLAAGKARTAARNLAREPSARAYAGLAHEHALRGSLSEVVRVTTEGLQHFPGDPELRRLQERARSLQMEGRTRALQEELRAGPRPALWKELCEILLDSGRVARAEDVASEWLQTDGGGEAQYYRALARARRFFADRRRDDGRLAAELIAQAAKTLPGDPRPLRLQLDLTSRVGAWAEARRAVAKLLEHFPGDPALEARFRSVDALSAGAPSFEQMLREVERTGRLADEDPDHAEQTPTTTGSVRTLLQRIAQEEGVAAAFFVRGSTALVQGPKGATAERTARGVREVVGSCRSAARRLGLGQVVEARLEGSFGTLLVAPTELAAGALWCTGEANRRHEELVRELTSAQAGTEERT